MENMVADLFLIDAQNVTDEANDRLTQEEKQNSEKNLDTYNKFLSSLNDEQRALFNDIDTFMAYEQAEHNLKLYYRALKRGITLGIDIAKTKF